MKLKKIRKIMKRRVLFMLDEMLDSLPKDTIKTPEGGIKALANSLLDGESCVEVAAKEKNEAEEDKEPWWLIRYRTKDGDEFFHKLKAATANHAKTWFIRKNIGYEVLEVTELIYPCPWWIVKYKEKSDRQGHIHECNIQAATEADARVEWQKSCQRPEELVYVGCERKIQKAKEE